MRILITNDDGINAPGLEVLTEIATEIAGPEGEVWTVAPAFEQSGVGHCISYTHPMMIAKLGAAPLCRRRQPGRLRAGGALRRAAGRAARSGAVGREPGQQRGRERAVFRHHRRRDGGGAAGPSGHCPVAVPRAATTRRPGRPVRGGAHPWRRAWCARFWTAGIWDDGDYRLFYNVNFPPVPAAAVKGIKVAAQGFRRDTAFGGRAAHVALGAQVPVDQGRPAAHADRCPAPMRR